MQDLVHGLLAAHLDDLVLEREGVLDLEEARLGREQARAVGGVVAPPGRAEVVRPVGGGQRRRHVAAAAVGRVVGGRGQLGVGVAAQVAGARVEPVGDVLAGRVDQGLQQQVTW